MMFISKFNKLIRSKILWFIFAVVIVFAFVFWDMNTEGIRQAELQNMAGELDGKIVSRREFQSIYMNVYFDTLMRVGDRLEMTERMREAMNEMTWERLASLRQAEKLGLSASDAEVAAAIQNDPTFMDQGRFVPERYQSFTRQILPQWGVSTQFYEDYVRQEVILSKLRFMVAQAVWVSPWDVESSFAQLYDTLQFSYVTISTNDVELPVEVAVAEAESFFEEAPEQYRIPVKMSVKYAVFPAADYVSEAEIDDLEVADYYDDNIETYSVLGTNGLTTPVPIDEVADEIRDILIQRAAMNAAHDAAGEFEIKLAPDRRGVGASFDETAAELGLAVSITEGFALNETVPGIDAGLDFNEAAFDLINRPDDYFSRPVRGESNVYILAWNTREDARIPAFDEVKERVMSDALRRAVAMALREQADSVRKALGESMADGSAFVEAAQSLGLDIVTTEPFELTADLEDESEAFYSLIEDVLSSNPGEMTDVVITRDGALIGYLESRKPADRSVFESMRNDIVRYMKRRRDPLVFREWASHLVADGRLVRADAPAERELEDDDDWDDEY